MLSFALSAGPGTLIGYGTGTIDDFNAMLGAAEYDLEEDGFAFEDTVTTIVGPADGTGE